jgi:hypothetical protein
MPTMLYNEAYPRCRERRPSHSYCTEYKQSCQREVRKARQRGYIQWCKKTSSLLDKRLATSRIWWSNSTNQQDRLKALIIMGQSPPDENCVIDLRPAFLIKVRPGSSASRWPQSQSPTTPYPASTGSEFCLSLKPFSQATYHLQLLMLILTSTWLPSKYCPWPRA